MVMDMLVKDEARHHALLRRIAASLREKLNWSQPTALPSGDASTDESATATADEVRALELEERHGAQELREPSPLAQPGSNFAWAGWNTST